MSFDPATTINQLTKANNGFNRLKAMTGASNFTRDDENQAVAFRFKMCKKFNYCRIKLNAMDTYDVTFLKIWGTNIKNEITLEGLYGDMLYDTFIENTGLYLTL